MRRITSAALAAALMLALPLTVVHAQSMDHSKMPMAASSQSTQALRTAMHKLWEDHIVYTRNFVISALAGLDDMGPVTDRLLRNQDDIGNAIKPYYGDAAGAKLAGLLREHIMIAADIVPKTFWEVAETLSARTRPAGSSR